MFVDCSKLFKKYGDSSYTPSSPCNKPVKSNNTSSNKQNSSLDNLPQPIHQHRRRLATEPGSIGSTSPIMSSSNCSSPVAVSPDNQFDRQQQHQPVNGNETNGNTNGGVDNCFMESMPIVPRSPRSQGMLHSIHHRFVATMNIKMHICNVCEKQMFFGYKCRDCKFYSHRDCSEKAPKSCGLPHEFFDVFKQKLNDNKNRVSQSPLFNHKPSLSSSSFSHARTKNLQFENHSGTTNTLGAHSSQSSSSNPSSPAMFGANQTSSSSSTTISPSSNKGSSQFQFPPDITLNGYGEDGDEDGRTSSRSSRKGEELCENEVVSLSSPKNFSTIQEEDEHKSNVESDVTSTNTVLITSESSGDSVRTVGARFDSQDSQASDMDQNDSNWPRQNSLTAREWDIPYDDLQIQQEIGTGRFGTVYKGLWHGGVAIKCIKIEDSACDTATMETFREEVETFRKTRHDNLVLFMGACMKLPHLAIVTSLCKGMTLYTHIHVRNDKFNLNRTILIAEQICNGMSYLHARGIIHKDLKTKNIFYENGKVIITDFGLSYVSKLCISNRQVLFEWCSLPSFIMFFLLEQARQLFERSNGMAVLFGTRSYSHFVRALRECRWSSIHHIH